MFSRFGQIKKKKVMNYHLCQCSSPSISNGWTDEDRGRPKRKKVKLETEQSF